MKNYDKIKKYLTNLDSTALNLYIGDIHIYFNEYQKILIYNKDIDLPLHKILIRTPKVKILNQLSIENNISYRIQIVIAPMTPEKKKFIDFILKIEDIMDSKLNTLFEKKLNKRSALKEFNDYMAILELKTPLKQKQFGFKCFDLNNDNIDIIDIKNGSYIACYIELSEIWINDDDYGFNWNVMQMKNYGPINFNICLFDDENKEDDINNSIVQVIPPPPPPLPPPIPPIPLMPLLQAPPNPHIQQNKSFIPSTEALISMKNKLKKVQSINKLDVILSQVELDNKQLKKVLQKHDDEYEAIIQS